MSILARMLSFFSDTDIRVHLRQSAVGFICFVFASIRGWSVRPQQLLPRRNPLFRPGFLTEKADPVVCSLCPQRGHVHVSCKLLTMGDSFFRDVVAYHARVC